MTIKRFVLGLLFASLLAIGIHNARAAEWDTIDKALFTNHVALQITDALQTNYIRQHPEQFKELNPVYGNPPNILAVVGVKSLVIGGTYWLVRDMNSSNRKTILTIVNLIDIGIVAHNASIGVHIGF